MDDLAVILEEGNLLNTSDGLATKALKSELKLLVVTASALVLHLVLSAGGTLATNAYVLLELLELISVHSCALTTRQPLRGEVPSNTLD